MLIASFHQSGSKISHLLLTTSSHPNNPFTIPQQINKFLTLFNVFLFFTLGRIRFYPINAFFINPRET
ncbi:hypothetical protein AKJ50_00935 [candidate division MSBL1 archaeon SCGC-AAA382A13]|uniref:Uncharacterized protein n=2 Tax=candidate division MSBL1 TaxID=215777 RepID=A0A133VEB8_9EURY|nr:hypothetical protein AKJ49_01740 [candidate division MSBL1 archaeon SCGC-AAA382A03]KXB05436.1 hypothetical protein AKJ50_00935 [candidate division MSBL1 archaeon SCGC-AAA382A13]